MVREVVVLHSMQPLTVDVGAVATSRVRVLTDATTPVWRADVQRHAEVVVANKEDWPALLASWATTRDLEVITNDEYCLADCARLRSDLGLARRQSQTLTRYLDKPEMKSALKAAGVAVPTWTKLDVVPTPGVGLPGELEFPVVAKPRAGSNSRGVRVIPDPDAWRKWLGDRQGQTGWQVEAHINAPMHFIDGVVGNGHYVPLMLGAYVGPLLPQPGETVLGAVELPKSDPLWEQGAELGEAVARALGDDGQFVTHLEFFDTPQGLVVMEAAARAPGALVSEMGRVALGINLEVLNLRLQAGVPLPALEHGVMHSAWISLLALTDQKFTDPPHTQSQASWTSLPPADGHSGRYVAAMVLMTNEDPEVLADDARTWQAHRWIRE